MLKSIREQSGVILFACALLLALGLLTYPRPEKLHAPTLAAPQFAVLPANTPAATPTCTPPPTFPPTWTPTSSPTATPTAFPSPTVTATPELPPTPTPRGRRAPTATPLPPPIFEPLRDPPPAGVLWIDISLSTQTLTAYDGPTPLNSFVVSTGKASTPTLVGQFRIWIKLRYDDMQGTDYHLRNVPFVMYFYRGYGIHGTYWHTNFGTPMSHGCVNMKTAEAEWLFNWAEVGTLVNVRP